MFAQVLQRVHLGLQPQSEERVSSVQTLDRVASVAEERRAHGDDNIATGERHRPVQRVAAEGEGARDHAVRLSGVQQEDAGAAGTAGHHSADGEVRED